MVCSGTFLIVFGILRVSLVVFFLPFFLSLFRISSTLNGKTIEKHYSGTYPPQKSNQVVVSNIFFSALTLENGRMIQFDLHICFKWMGFSPPPSIFWPYQGLFSPIGARFTLRTGNIFQPLLDPWVGNVRVGY